MFLLLLCLLKSTLVQHVIVESLVVVFLVQCFLNGCLLFLTFINLMSVLSDCTPFINSARFSGRVVALLIAN